MRDYVSYGEARGYASYVGEASHVAEGKDELALPCTCRVCATVKRLPEQHSRTKQHLAALFGHGGQCKKNAPELKELGARRGGDSV